MINVLKDRSFQCRVSSVLNKDVKQLGKKFMFDGLEDTCWNSDQGTPQWVIVELENPTQINAFNIQFQGGFAGSECHVELKSDVMDRVEPFYPEDKNSLQTFKLSEPVVVKSLRFVFNKSTDFFGRIIIYKLEVLNSV